MKWTPLTTKDFIKKWFGKGGVIGITTKDLEEIKYDLDAIVTVKEEYKKGYADGIRDFTGQDLPNDKYEECDASEFDIY